MPAHHGHSLRRTVICSRQPTAYAAYAAYAAYSCFSSVGAERMNAVRLTVFEGTSSSLGAVSGSGSGSDAT